MAKKVVLTVFYETIHVHTMEILLHAVSWFFMKGNFGKLKVNFLFVDFLRNLLRQKEHRFRTFYLLFDILLIPYFVVKHGIYF